jgi:hypothetical protein
VEFPGGILGANSRDIPHSDNATRDGSFDALADRASDIERCFCPPLHDHATPLGETVGGIVWLRPDVGQIEVGVGVDHARHEHGVAIDEDRSSLGLREIADFIGIAHREYLAAEGRGIVRGRPPHKNGCGGERRANGIDGTIGQDEHSSVCAHVHRLLNPVRYCVERGSMEQPGQLACIREYLANGNVNGLFLCDVL